MLGIEEATAGKCEEIMKPKLVFAVAIGFMLATCGLVLCLYWFGGDFKSGYSKESSDWANFGSYFGGVVAPILSFAVILLLVATVLQQEFTTRKISLDGIKQDHLRYLAAIQRDIQFLMERPLTGDSDEVLFGDYMIRMSGRPAQSNRQFRALVSLLVEYVGEYSEALALYQANVAVGLEYRLHRARLRRYLAFLESELDFVSDIQKVTLGFARDHLNKLQ